MEKFQPRLAIWATQSPQCNRLITFFALTLLIVLLQACSSGVKYHAGVVTRSVEGTIKSAGEPVSEKVFIIVRKHNRTLIETSTGYLYRISADIVFPTAEGKFRVEMEDAVDEIDLYVIAKGYSVKSHSFKRTLGVAGYEMDIDMEKSLNWRNEYGYFIKPFVSDFIVEPRYELLPSHQMFLGDWMNEVEDSSDMLKKEH